MLLKKSSRSSTNTSRSSHRRLLAGIGSVRKYVKVVPLILVLVLVVFAVHSATMINKVSCQVNGRVCPKEIEGVLWHMAGKNYFTINQKELQWGIKQIFPLDSLKLNFSYPNTLHAQITGVQEAYSVEVYQVPTLPVLSLDLYGSSSESAQWSRPVPEIERYISPLEGTSQRIWENGNLTADTSSVSGEIKFAYSSIPSQDQISNIYKIIVLAKRYLEDPKIYILSDRVFLSSPNLPDIIIYVDAPLNNIESSLQSLDFLVTIKKDARVFNLSFKHPIIK